ncbi:hypothetical protein ACQKJZ_08840 [Sphingomonas sp. NPDC019816]|uniref:hypothetical protein n=1 Tax=Sphingomonas sp. NPDC019816 TaxID=3390679 RepID=UPI003CFC0B8A
MGILSIVSPGLFQSVHQAFVPQYDEVMRKAAITYVVQQVDMPYDDAEAYLDSIYMLRPDQMQTRQGWASLAILIFAGLVTPPTEH